MRQDDKAQEPATTVATQMLDMILPIYDAATGLKNRAVREGWSEESADAIGLAFFESAVTPLLTTLGNAVAGGAR